jgi:hypothetical protein
VLEWVAAEEDARNAAFEAELPHSAREALESWSFLSA